MSPLFNKVLAEKFVGDSATDQTVTHLVLETEDDGTCFLLRYTSDGECADTWHVTMEEAMRQAEFEYRLAGDWLPLADRQER